MLCLPSVVANLSVTVMQPTQMIELFGSICTL